MSENPYAAGNVSETSFSPGTGGLPPDVVKKVEAIIKDARQFWLAIVLCFFCSGIGLVIIFPWYLFRLFQWRSLAQQHPFLTEPNAPTGSLPKRFQSAKLKLILGIVFGLLTFGLLVGLLLPAITAAREAADAANQR
ncbi:putative signal peptide protein [Rhodopirellula islandica]|uniref:Signal peptide protein n=1 Tax=Rhodopirellula islandica TaxID=595434 RepID=A0A0J1EHH7_RHOIS|nr:hypothetical protein [Rhodopirellula islandica]KLU04964.1 putative signal peptide protein [Rhodopirellula islandica]